jgi:hypothetical protein
MKLFFATLRSKLNDSVELSEQVIKLSPSTESNRLLYATDFSFAVSDMLDLTSIERQLLLECNILQDRLFSIKNYLKNYYIKYL